MWLRIALAALVAAAATGAATEVPAATELNNGTPAHAAEAIGRAMSAGLLGGPQGFSFPAMTGGAPCALALPIAGGAIWYAPAPPPDAAQRTAIAEALPSLVAARQFGLITPTGLLLATSPRMVPAVLPLAVAIGPAGGIRAPGIRVHIR